MSISELKGKTLKSVDGLVEDNDIVIFKCTDGSVYHMYHCQDCCEHVRIVDICGDVEDLQNSLVVGAYQSTSNAEDVSDYGTWTFYHIQTTKGSVVIRWLGESNGYYSESVDFKLINKGE